MRCPLCNNDLLIASSFLQPKAADDGSLEVYSVIDLMCTDPHCPNGKKKLPIARESTLVENANKTRNALSCCGVPLAYIGGDTYWVPDTVSAAITEDGAQLAVTCASCGERHVADISGKTRAE